MMTCLFGILGVMLGLVGLFVLICTPHNLRVRRVQRVYKSLPTKVIDQVLHLIEQASVCGPSVTFLRLAEEVAYKPDRLRIEYLKTIETPTLILQGERDALGSKDEVKGHRLSGRIEVRWLPDGDHSFKPRKASGRTTEENWQDGIEAVADFVQVLANR